ncbi:hypothetical protein [Pseudonocardia nigra]|uniref:hypothetical protein n=1 Tax=Pseudonocardia nigra TaxID=1921578 RepID=UPI001C5E0E16|nr:hypothetical protein [Pseudonocardia nigra]
MVAANDLAFPGVGTGPTAAMRLMNAYLARLLATAANDAELAAVFVRVAGLVDGPGALLSPRTALRVLRTGPTRAAARKVCARATGGADLPL